MFDLTLEKREATYLAEFYMEYSGGLQPNSAQSNSFAAKILEQSFEWENDMRNSVILQLIIN